MPSIVRQARQSPVRQQQQQQPPVALRAPADDEHYVMWRFAAHTTRCSHCKQPLDVVRKGTALCRTGALHAQLITQYLYSENGKVFSLVDRDMQHRYVQVHVPKDCTVVRELMLAAERGLSTDHHSQAPDPAEKQKQPEVLLTMNNTQLRRYSDSSNGKGSGNSQQLVLARPSRKKPSNANRSRQRGTLYGNDMGYASSEAVSQFSDDDDDDLFIFPERPAT